MKKLHTFPDMVLQYAHHVRDELRTQGVEDPVITVDWMCSLNGAPHRRLVDPSVDLARQERSWRPAPWVFRDPGEAEHAGASDSGAQSTGLLSSGTSLSTSKP